MYWLVYLDSLEEPNGRARLARRLLIGSAEDGHSIKVMEAVADHYPQLVRDRTDIIHLASEVLRICKFPNWWHPQSRGKDYIYSGLLAERRLLQDAGQQTVEKMTRVIEQGIEEGDKVSAVAGVLGLSDARLSATRQAEILAKIAEGRGHRQARRLIQIHLRCKSALASDNNFLTQAAWMMAGGQSPIAEEFEQVWAGEVYELLEPARERLKNPRPIPRWCCDGTHSAWG